MNKKILVLLFSLVFSLSIIVPAFAGEEEPAETTQPQMQIQAQPRVMVTDYSVDGTVAPGSVFKLKISITNQSQVTNVRNIKLTVSESSGSILPWKIDSVYVAALGKGATTMCELTMKASEDVAASYCNVQVSMEYEDYEGQSYSSSDTLILSVKNQKKVTADTSQPLLMVTDYSINGIPGKDKFFTLSLVISNKSTTKDVKNVKVTFSDGSGIIVPADVSSGFISSIPKNSTSTWTISLKAASANEGGTCMSSISMEYETPDGEKLSSSDSVVISMFKKEASTADASQPRLMVIAYSVESGFISPDEKRNLSVTIKNTNEKKAVKNIKISIADTTGELKPEGTGSFFVSSIDAGESYTWTTGIAATHSAATGEHSVTFSTEYEDESGAPYSTSDTFSLPVRQNAALSFNNAQLPIKVTQGDTESLTVSFMNTGKSIISNCLMDAEISHLENGGSVLVGEIKPGETKSGTMNLRIDSDFVGDTDGTLYISYEDEFGEVYKEEVKISTYIQEKVDIVEVVEEKEKKYPLWWLFALIGVVVGGGLGAGIPIAIYSSKQRKIDEETL